MGKLSPLATWLGLLFSICWRWRLAFPLVIKTEHVCTLCWAISYSVIVLPFCVFRTPVFRLRSAGFLCRHVFSGTQRICKLGLDDWRKLFISPAYQTLSRCHVIALAGQAFEKYEVWTADNYKYNYRLLLRTAGSHVILTGKCSYLLSNTCWRSQLHFEESCEKWFLFLFSFLSFWTENVVWTMVETVKINK